MNSMEMQPGCYALPGADLGGSATGTPGGDDGRAGEAGAPLARPALQEPWGWGMAPAQASERVERALTHLPKNPVGYSARQQVAVRRDQAERLGAVAAYGPVPHVGDDIL